MKPKTNQLNTRAFFLAVAACLVFGVATVRAGGDNYCLYYTKGNALQDGATSTYATGASYSGVVDGVISDTSASTALATGSPQTLGNQFRSGSANGQQYLGIYSYDLTDLNNFIAANTSSSSSVSIQSVSFSLVSAGGVSGGFMTLGLYQTDPFNSSATWATTDGTTAWSSPYQSGLSGTYSATGGASALTANLGTSSPGTTVTAGNALNWSSSATFITALQTALARSDKKLHLTVRGTFFNNGDNRLNAYFSSDTTVANRPKLTVTLQVTTTGTWTGASSTSWATAGNWTPAGVPATGNQIIFNSSSTANLSTVLNQDFSIASLTLTTPSAPVSIGGANTLTISTASGIDMSGANQNLTITTPVALGIGQSWNVAASRTLTVNGNISGAFTLTKDSAGTLVLGGNNAHSALTVNGGTVSFASDGSSGNQPLGAYPASTTAAAVTLTGGAGLLNTSSTTIFANRGITLGSGGGTLDASSGQNLTISSKITGSSTLTKGSNSSTVTINSDSTGFTGPTTINGGTLAISSSGRLYNTAGGSYVVTVNSGATLSVYAWAYAPLGSIGADFFGYSTLVVNGGTITYTGIGEGSGSANNGRVFTIGTGGATLNAAGSGTWYLEANSGTDGTSPVIGQSIPAGLTLTLSGTAAGQYNKVISGSGSLIKSGTGTWTLAGANTYSGDTTNSQGTLKVGAAGTLPNGAGKGNVVFNTPANTAILDINGFDTTINGLSGNASSANKVANNASATTKTLTVGNNDISSSFGGVLADNTGTGGTLAVTKIGTGTLTLSGANTYTGKTTITAGTLALSGSGSLTSPTIIVAGGATLDVSTLSSTFILASSQTLTNSGATTAILKGNANTGSGKVNLAYASGTPALQVTSGTLTLFSSTTFTVNNTGAMLPAGSYTIIQANGGTVAGTLPSVAVTGGGATGVPSLSLDGSGNLILNVQDTAWSGAVDNSWLTPGNWTSGSVPNPGDPINFNSSSTANLSTVLNGNFSISTLIQTAPTGPVSIDAGGAYTLAITNGINLASAAQDMTINAPVQLGASQSWTVANTRTLSVNGGVSGSAALTISGAGKVSLGGAATHTGDTTVSSGSTLQMAAANVLPNVGGGGNVNVNGVLDLNANAETVNGLNGSGVVDNTAAGTVTLTIGSNNTNSSFSGMLQNTGGALALFKTGNGTLTLSGSNSYSGGTTINAGNLVPGTANAVGSSTVIVNSNGTFYPVAGLTFTNSVTLNGGALEIGGGNNNVLGFSGLVTVTADSAIKVDGGAYGVYMNGGVNMGSGNYTLSSFNNNSGKGSQLSGITGANGTIMNVAANGTLWIQGTNTFAGTFRASNGPISFLNAYSAQNATLDMNAADIGAVGFSTSSVLGALTGSRNLNLGTITVSVGNNNASTTYSGALTNSGALTKIGSGTLTLSGNNTYTGNTVISNGTLALSGSGAIASANVRVATGATFDVSAVTGGSYTLNGSRSLTLNIAKAGLSLTQGQVQAASLTAGGTLNVTASGDALTGGESFTLFNVTPGGTFSVTNLPSLSTGLNWFTANNYRTLSVNRAPVAQPQSLTLAQGDAASLTVIGGKYSPTDVDPGDTANLIVTAVGAASPGSAGTAGFTSSNVTFTASNNFSGTATFSYTVSDGRGGSDTKTVTVTVTPAASGANLALPTFNSPGEATLNGFGIPGHTYQLQYTESLSPVNWQDVTGPLATAAASLSNGTISLVDTNAGGPSRFYRTRHVSAP